MLSRRQKAVAKALYDGQLSEAEVMARFRVSPTIMQRWLADETFRRELDRLCEDSAREARFIIARCGPVAAVRLAELLGSDKPDVARRAALDVIERCGGKGRGGDNEPAGDEEVAVSDEEARAMLKALAGGYVERGA